MTAESKRQYAIVEFFSLDRGYGFARPEDGGKDIFIHASVLEAIGGAVRAGERISYVVGKSAKNGKPMAAEVRRA